MCYRPGPQSEPKSFDAIRRKVRDETASALERRLKLYAALFPVKALTLRHWSINGIVCRTDIVIARMKKFALPDGT